MVPLALDKYKWTEQGMLRPEVSVKIWRAFGARPVL